MPPGGFPPPGREEQFVEEPAGAEELQQFGPQVPHLSFFFN